MRSLIIVPSMALIAQSAVWLDWEAGGMIIRAVVLLAVFINVHVAMER